MAAEQRRLLEQLMGTPTASHSNSVHFTDSSVCRSFLVGTCPHDLFTNTKQDLGPCKRSHSEAHKSAYEADKSAGRDPGFELDYSRDLSRFISECDRRIEAAQRRLDKTPDEISKTNTLLKAISNAEKTIAAGLEEVEVLGTTGSVQKALDTFQQVKIAKAEKETRERELKNLAESAGPSGHQKLQVCDVCGAYLSRLDNDRRLADHFYGKMHLGYAQMRNTYKRLQEDFAKRGGPPVQKEERVEERAGRGDGFERGGGYERRGGGGYRGGGRGSGGGYRGGRSDGWSRGGGGYDRRGGGGGYGGRY